MYQGPDALKTGHLECAGDFLNKKKQPAILVDMSATLVAFEAQLSLL
jgi:hypothetical protein